MTTTLPQSFVFGPGFKNANKIGVGILDHIDRIARTFESMDTMKPTVNFPPYNIIRSNENQYIIEMAVAGFMIDQIDIEFKEGYLTVSGESESLSQDQEGVEYLFRGIANRSFSRSFILDEHLVVESARMDNGMLTITLERIIPEHLKPRKIEVLSV